eukprot:CAMPEP_0172053066 /NCGR_PEP_ID=MMETSP1043-20130122/4010_1 /TAXON_ID=464988 /ORGANISM="Hemiselmis andersenii, Strain CCMP441" /LENGTH=239 /DNA_ID=CAMNT_0012712295 /DNA_START=74 /DNA_END=794 /DNA_ORIENTATION=+
MSAIRSGGGGWDPTGAAPSPPGHLQDSYDSSRLASKILPTSTSMGHSATTSLHADAHAFPVAVLVVVLTWWILLACTPTSLSPYESRPPSLPSFESGFPKQGVTMPSPSTPLPTADALFLRTHRGHIPRRVGFPSQGWTALALFFQRQHRAPRQFPLLNRAPPHAGLTTPYLSTPLPTADALFLRTQPGHTHRHAGPTVPLRAAARFARVQRQLSPLRPRTPTTPYANFHAADAQFLLV